MRVIREARIARPGARRRVAPPRRQRSGASLTAEAGIAVFRVAFERWVEEPTHQDVPRSIRESLDELKSVAAGN